MTNQILIKNGIVLTGGDASRVLYGHDVLIEGKKIRQITSSIDAAQDDTQVIDATGKVVMPGMINAHMHFYSTFARGLTQAQPSINFQEILEHLWWRFDKKLTLEDVYYSTLIILLDAIRHGTTTFFDHHSSPFSAIGSLSEIARAVNDAGLRACLCYELSDRDGEKSSQEGFEENVRFIRACQHRPSDQLKALFGLHASFTVSDSTLEKVVMAADGLNTGFHVHVAEAILDQEKTLAMCGERVIERFYRHGVLGRQTLVAHGVHLNEHEMDLLAETDTMLVHNPQSNLNNGVGIADIVAMEKKGILVGLGTDAMTVNMFEECRVAVWAQHLRANPSIGFLEAVKTLYHHNARIAGRIWNDNHLGMVEEGAVADVILVDYLPPTPLTDDTLFGHLIFGLSGAVVDTTIVNGRVLMRNKQLTLDIDEAEIASRARVLAKKLWERF